MKYEKPEVEFVEFDFAGFMTGSPNGNPTEPTTPVSCYSHTDSVGHQCVTYTQGVSCGSWTTPSFGGGTCNNYNGKKCYSYTDSTHNHCNEYGVS